MKPAWSNAPIATPGSSTAASKARSIKTLRRGAAALVLAIATYLAAALAGALIPGRVAPVAQGPGETEILLISGPIHYDILLPLDDRTRDAFGFLEPAGYPLPDWADWLVVGWGAQTFYTTTGSYADVNATALWRGLTGDSSVMRVELAGPLRDDLPFHRLTLNHAQYAALLENITASFATPARRLPVPGFSQTDAFFAANGRFHIFRTCNTWIGRVLRASGHPFGAWTPTPYAVTLSLALR